MKNSICLPLPTSENSPAVVARCFIVFPNGDREISPYPFTLRTIRNLNAARKADLEEFGHEPKWCATLFFPEMWPPSLIRQAIAEKPPSIDSGIHLPIRSRIDRWLDPTRTFIATAQGFREVPMEPFTEQHVRHYSALVKELDLRCGHESSFSPMLWFPGTWQPSEIDEFLRSPVYQPVLFPF